MVTTRPPKRGNRLAVTVMLDEDQFQRFDEIAWERRTNRSALAREAIDFFLAANMRDTDITNHDVHEKDEPAHVV